MELWPQPFAFCLVSSFRHNVSVMDAHQKHMEKDPTPPLPGPVVQQKVAHHLVTQVHSLHIGLIVCQAGRYRDVSTFPVLAPPHSPGCRWVVEFGQDAHWLRVLPVSKHKLVALSHLCLVSPQSRPAFLGNCLSWQVPPVCPHTPTGLNIQKLQVFHETDRGEKVIEVHLCLGSLQHSAHVHDNPVAEAVFSHSGLPARVDLEVADVSSGALCHGPHFDDPLDRLHRHVLPNCQTSLELNHGLINREGWA